MEIEFLLCADDLVPLSPTEQRLRQNLALLEQHCQTWAPTINLDKTRVMVFQKKSQTSGKQTVDFGYLLYNNQPPKSFKPAPSSFGHSKDIYTGWAAQVLKTTLLTETWQRKEHELPSNCSLPEHVLNIKRIKLPGPVEFCSHFDHAKWCVSQEDGDQWICIGDLNREDCQQWKSGGLICSQNPVIYHAFRGAVSWFVRCRDMFKL